MTQGIPRDASCAVSWLASTSTFTKVACGKSEASCSKMGAMRWQGPHHVAVKTGKVATLKLLLDAGAGIDDRTAVGSTPLMLAASRGDVKVIKYLLSRGADPTLRALPPYTARTAAQTARKRKHRLSVSVPSSS